MKVEGAGFFFGLHGAFVGRAFGAEAPRETRQHDGKIGSSSQLHETQLTGTGTSRKNQHDLGGFIRPTPEK